MLCFFPANLMSSTYTDKKNPFSRCTKRHSQLETFSQPYFNKIFSNCLSHNSPAKGWPYRFRSRGTTGSSILDHDLGHLCRGRRIQLSGHSDFGIFSTICEHLPFWPGYKQILHKLLVLRTLAIWIWYPWPLLLSLWCWWSLFSEYCIRTRIVFYNITAEHDSTFVFLVFCLQFSIRQCTSVEWFFSRRVEFDSWFNVKAVYEVSWHGPKIIHSFTSIRTWVLRWWKRPFWFSKKNQGDFLLELVGAVSRWVFSVPDLLREVWFVHLRLENTFSFWNITSFALSLFE